MEGGEGYAYNTQMDESKVVEVRPHTLTQGKDLSKEADARQRKIPGGHDRYENSCSQQ